MTNIFSIVFITLFFTVYKRLVFVTISIVDRGYPGGTGKEDPTIQVLGEFETSHRDGEEWC